MKTMDIKEFSKLSGFPLTTCYKLARRKDFPSKKSREELENFKIRSRSVAYKLF